MRINGEEGAEIEIHFNWLTRMRDGKSNQWLGKQKELGQVELDCLHFYRVVLDDPW